MHCLCCRFDGGLLADQRLFTDVAEAMQEQQKEQQVQRLQCWKWDDNSLSEQLELFLRIGESLKLPDNIIKHTSFIALTRVEAIIEMTTLLEKQLHLTCTLIIKLEIQLMIMEALCTVTIHLLVLIIPS